MFLADLIAHESLELNASFGNLAPFLADFFSLVTREAHEKILEARVSVVAPVKLHAAANHHAR